ncbi:tRNA (adenosine(37)-N6)-threonylcarbamoyltransferase complex dimerization subunit type 1 TsaB [Sandarakinorhabdus sp.]|uniref:tRNA (adenosine(37)-N6)-threonylcarbamoyltransferase complex dimerization subunit type 1 TsaB n=1 Tax=Sandarakinorhabdus sp. TaxID=1916663 RepID=UPI00286D6E43|nr:tRNA (adenosine(37)-N6)-threonylcarbamoyltransferase complex dimerization subunit type 1 TsaB [Sandarakinorhabdus sp.]
MTITLAISTSSPALSLALDEDGRLLSRHHAIIGRGHAEALIPAIIAMLGTVRPHAILVDVGPGSFTGIRIGIAAARALGLAWGVPVAGFSAVSLAAAAAFAARPGLDSVTVLLDAGRGQILQSQVGADGVTTDIVLSAAPILAPATPVAGAGVALLARQDLDIVHGDQPDAANAAGLPLAVRNLHPAALYVRAADAVMPLA